MKSFRRNLKAISPIFATLILIAIAVIAGVVVYMFTSGTLAGMTSSGTAGQEKVTVQSASGTSTTVTLYAQSTGGPVPPTTGLTVILKDATGNTVATSSSVTATTWAGGALSTISAGTFKDSAGTAYTIKGTYTATLVTPAGGSFVSSVFSVA